MSTVAAREVVQRQGPHHHSSKVVVLHVANLSHNAVITLTIIIIIIISIIITIPHPLTIIISIIITISILLQLGPHHHPSWCRLCLWTTSVEESGGGADDGDDVGHGHTTLRLRGVGTLRDASRSELNSKHWFTTSSVWGKVPESDARSVVVSLQHNVVWTSPLPSSCAPSLLFQRSCPEARPTPSLLQTDSASRNEPVIPEKKAVNYLSFLSTGSASLNTITPITTTTTPAQRSQRGQAHTITPTQRSGSHTITSTQRSHAEARLTLSLLPRGHTLTQAGLTPSLRPRGHTEVRLTPSLPPRGHTEVRLTPSHSRRGHMQRPSSHHHSHPQVTQRSGSHYHTQAEVTCRGQAHTITPTQRSHTGQAQPISPPRGHAEVRLTPSILQTSYTFKAK